VGLQGNPDQSRIRFRSVFLTEAWHDNAFGKAHGFAFRKWLIDNAKRQNNENIFEQEQSKIYYSKYFRGRNKNKCLPA
jgi:hypothetical protein